MNITDKEIIEGKIVLAKFMGWQYKGLIKDFYFFGKERHFFTGNTLPLLGREGFFIDFFRYDKDYSWLMPVWQKFRDLKFDVVDERIFKHQDYKHEIGTLILCNDTPLEPFKLLVEAVNWYNSLKK